MVRFFISGSSKFFAGSFRLKIPIYVEPVVSRNFWCGKRACRYEGNGAA
jgi:hypothetical protein